MGEDNLSAVMHGKGDMRMEQTPIPEPGHNELLLRISNVGICGSDVSYYTKGICGTLKLDGPLIIGHEASGIVHKCGPGVNNFKPGDRVAIEPGVSCMVCEICKKGRYNLCKKAKFCIRPPTNGTLVRYLKHSADFCFKLADNVTMEEGALAEPLCVALHACRRSQVEIGSKILITGSGTIGMATLLVAKSMGASTVCMTDIQESRLKKAKHMGADIALNATGKDLQTFSSEIEAKMGCKPDITIECSGIESNVQLGIITTRPGGNLGLVGIGQLEATIPIADVIFKEISMCGIIRYPNCYPTVLDMLASSKVDAKALISHRYPLEEMPKALETFLSGNGLKIMISC